MSKYGELKIYSELAWAGYADFLSADDSGDISTTGMQRYNFRKQFKVIDSYEQREGGSGFQATLFQNRDTEEYILSIRGTEVGTNPIKWYETIKDTIIADGNLAISSMPGGQTSDMISFINKLNNESKIPEKQKITIVGHSLGGALAQIASKMFPDLFSKVYTFNAPSGKSLVYKQIYKDGEKYFWIGNEQVNSKHYVDKNIGEAFYNYQNSTVTTPVTDVRAKDALSLIANLWWKERFGELVEVSGETHFISPMTKILYFYDEMIKNGIREEEITDYLSGFHKGSALFGHNGNGVERVAYKTLNVINKIVNGNNAEQKDIIDMIIDFEKNDTKFSINLLHRDSSVSSFFINSSITTPALYALVNLNPFIVSGIDSPAYKEFEKYKDEYSDDYIKDKVKMFEAALKYSDKKPVNFNYFDIETKKELYSNPAGNSDKETDVIFGVNLDETIQARPNFNNRIYALAGNDSIKGGKHDNYIEAGPGNDTIDLRSSQGENIVYGGVNNGKDSDDDGDDTIYAGQEKDTIYGGNGKDTIYTDNDDKKDLLYGGQGFDTYYVGDKDVIFDSDGKGKVVFDSVELKGGTYDKDKGVYLSKDGLIEYRLNESGGKSTLTVQKGGKSITINEFGKEDKSLGIKLANSKVEVSVTNKEGSDRWLQESLGDRGLPFTLSLSRKLDKGEYLKVEVVTSMKGDKSIIEFKEGDISKDFNFTWEDDNDPQGNRSFVVNASVVDESSDLTAEVVSSGRGMIKDDDRDPDNPNRPNNPDTPNDTFPDTTPASTKTSPIVIDLNGDGIKTISRKNGKTYFDLDNNKFAENTSWIDKNDGILINKTLIATNSITSGSELFGNHTLLKDGSLADNGFEALKEFDENKDGVINEIDTLAYENLAIWQDANQNAKLDDSELKSLKELGIKEISLNYANSNFIDENGNEHRQTSNITFTNGNKATISDVWLDTHAADTRYVGEKIVLSDAVKTLPQIYAFGEVLNLHQAMAKDKVLQTMVENYIASDKAKQNEMINDIIYRWANSDQIDPNSRDPKKVYSHVMDARQLVALEHLTGKGYLGTWCWNEKDPNPHGQAAPLLIDEFNKFAKYAQAQISAQSEFRDLFAGILPLQWEKNQTGDLSIAFKALKDRIADLLPNVDYANISADNIIQVRELVNTAKNLGSYNTKYQSVFETIEAGWLSEIENLKFVINSVKGTDGNDNLSGDNKDNNIIGGSGDDILFGGAGNDMYYFDILFGKDRVYDSAGVDGIVFSKNIKPENIELTRNKTSIYITRLDDNKAKTNDIIQIDNFFEYNGDIGNGAIEKIVFQNGTQWDINKIIEILAPQPTQGNDNLYGDMKDNIISGLGGNDIIYGGNGNDTINGNDGNDELHGDDGNDQLFGGDGNDILYGNNGSDILIGNDGNDSICGHGGNDVLEGGKGNDVLEGDYGDDTYVYNKGDGNDTIRDYYGKNTLEFKDINKDGVEFFSNGAGLLIKIKETQDTISLNSQNSDFSFKFSDGTILEDKDINLTINGDDGSNILYGLKGNDAIVGNGGDDIIYGNYGDDVLKGNDGNDSIYGHGGNDVLEGGKGNDVLEGDYGDDTYVYNKGDGNDTIRDYYGKNTLEFKDINKDGVEFSAKGNDLLITVKDTQEYITLKDIFWQNSDFNFKFADGNTIGIRDLVLTFTGDDGDNDLYGYIGNDVLEGGKGNDYLYGRSGNDVYIYNKGDGNDTIYDFQGNNTIEFKDLNKDEIIFTEDQGGLLVKIRDTNEQITIMNFFNSESSSMSFKFADGTILDENGAKVATFIGDNNNNTIHGLDSDDILKGNGGNDTIYGGKGDDDIEGGIGNDILIGNEGIDTYVFGRGDGQDIIYALDADSKQFNIGTKGTDIIKFKEGVTKNDLIFERAGANGHDLLIKIKDTDDSITVKDMFSDIVSSKGIDKIEFADGSFIGTDDIYKNTPLVINRANQEQTNGSVYSDAIIGNDQDNIVYANDGDDTLTGGKGNDYLDGESGNDVYVYNKGDGNDTIYDFQGNNTIEFKDLNKDEIIFTEDQGSLLVKIRDTNEQITIMNFFNSESSSMSFKFADGTILDENGAKAAALIGDNNDNMIQGYDSNDILKGNGGNDTIYGGKGDDDIEGGTGNDILVGNTGVDTYVFGRGDGQDIIYALDADSKQFNIGTKGTDIIKFKEGVTKNDLIFERVGANGHDLLIKIKDTDDSITVKDMFSDAVSSRGIDKIEFADGSFMDIEDIHKSTPIITNQYNQQQIYGSIYSDTIIGDEQNNSIQGKDGNDVIHGYEGEDKLYGDTGNDTLIGGKGNDYLDGGSGNDVYIYNTGDGNDTIYDANGTDTIKFGPGISKQDIIVKRTNVENAQDYRNITISFKNSPNDSITVLDVSTGNTTNDSNTIETFEFENGEKLSFEDIKKLSLIGTEVSENIIGYVHANNIIKGNGGDDKLYGQEGNDTIDGGEGNDIIEGGSGNDTLIGGAGNDTLNGSIGDDVYVYNKGDGNDTIIDTGGTDIIKFGQGINKEDLVATKSGDEHYKDITLTFKNSPSDSIVIKEVFMGENIKANNKIETLEFANGERLKIEDIKLNIIGSKENDDIRGYNYFSNIIKGNGGDDTLYGGDMDDTLYGEDGNDRLYGGRGNDTLMGQDGDDELNGQDGNDIIEGGSGNDTLYGGSGEDVYLFKRGDGQDTVYADGNDIVKFKAGLTQNDLILRRSESLKDGFSNGLILKIKDSHDSIVIRDAFKDENNSYGIKGVEFDDGSFMSFAEIKRKVLVSSDQEQTVFEGFNSDDTIIGGDGNDYLSGNGGNDTLIGNNGDDRIDGGDGDDIITGGKGDDELSGGSGSDTYVFGRGDGKDSITNYDDDPNKTDVIKFKEGIVRDDLILQKLRTFKYGSDFLIKIKGSDDSILVKNMFDIEDNNYVLNEKSKIDKIEFGDGSFMDIEDIKQALKNNNVIIHENGSFWEDSEGSDEDDEIYGNDDDNSLKGNKGDDILVGGKGSDSLYGGEGNDTYVFGRGDGEDTIYNYDPTPNRRDIIKFKEGITKDDLIFKRSLNYNNQNDSLIIEIKGTSDSVTVSGMFRDENTTDCIDGIEFSDGTFMDFNDIKQKVLTSPDSNDNNIYGFSSDDVLIGGDGNDYLDGYGGNDTMKGGLGNDTYTYDYRSGHIAIEDIGGEDTLYINAPKTGLKFKKDGNDLFISSSDNHDQSIRIKNHFLSDNYSIDKISFNPHGEYFLTKDDINKLANAVYLSSEGGNNYLSDKDKKDNVYTYTGGKVTISDNGGDDRVVFKLDNPGDGLFYLSNGRDLKISTNKIDASNNDVLEIKNFFVNRSSIIENFDINDYWSVTAQSIYEQYGKTFPPETPGTPPSNPGGSDESSLIGGSEDNVFNYKGGMVSITDTGGNDKVIFKNPGSRVFYSSDGIDLMISTAKIDSSNNNILQVKNFFASKDSIIETFQINDSWSVTAQSIYKALGKTYPNQTAPVNNNPTTPPNSDNLIGGKEDNVFTYTGGKKSITDTGGNDKVIFKNPGSKVFYSSDGVNLKISTAKINSSNKDVLEVKNFFSDKNAIIEKFQISDRWTVTAESIYQAFGKTYPTSTDTKNAPLALLGIPNNTSEAGLNDNNASDT